jgi:hypothetical protein
MKKILTFTAIIMIGLAAFTGCKKSSSSTSYTMKATIGGTTTTFNTCVAAASGTLMTISGFNGSGTTATPPYLQVYMSNFTGVGTYNIDATTTTNMGSYYINSTTAKLAQTGTITITSSSTASIAGTFNFTTTDGTVISGASFTAKRY